MVKKQNSDVGNNIVNRCFDLYSEFENLKKKKEMFEQGLNDINSKINSIGAQISELRGILKKEFGIDDDSFAKKIEEISKQRQEDTSKEKQK